MGGRLFGGLVQDVRRKACWYPSDFLDALHPQCFSAVLYIYLATVTNAITFGGLLGDATEGAQVRGFVGWDWHQLWCSTCLPLGTVSGAEKLGLLCRDDWILC